MTEQTESALSQFHIYYEYTEDPSYMIEVIRRQLQRVKAESLRTWVIVALRAGRR